MQGEVSKPVVVKIWRSTMARRPFFSSFSLYSSNWGPSDRPRGSKGPAQSKTQSAMYAVGLPLKVSSSGPDFWDGDDSALLHTTAGCQNLRALSLPDGIASLVCCNTKHIHRV